MKKGTTLLRTLLLVLLGTMLGTMSVSAQTKQAYAYVSTADRETLFYVAFQIIGKYLLFINY